MLPPTGPLRPVDCPVCGSRAARVRYDGLAIGEERTRLLVCRSCGSGYISPRPVGDDLDRQYTDPDYLRYHYEELYLPIIDAVVEHTRCTVRVIEAFHAPGSLLDFGCGVGPVAAAAAGSGWKTLGFDVSPIAIETGRDLLGTEVVGTWDAVLASPLAPFDVVAAIEVVEHVEDPGAVIQLAMQALKPGGILVVSTPNFGSVERLRHGARWHAVLPATHILYLTASSLRGLLKGCGAEPLRVLHWGNLLGRLPASHSLVRRLGDPPGGPNLLAFARKPTECRRRLPIV